MSGAPDEDAQGSRRGALVGLLVVVLLIAAVVVVVSRLGAASRVQDCVQAGRTNCAPVQGGDRR